jgi:hypothetical protein
LRAVGSAGGIHAEVRIGGSIFPKACAPSIRRPSRTDRCEAQRPVLGVRAAETRRPTTDEWGFCFHRERRPIGPASSCPCRR